MQKRLNEKELSVLYGAYRDSDAVACEIIRLYSMLDLPKGTEHFLSDLHGEAEAFLHIRKNASGVIRRKVDALFGGTLTEGERAELSTLIYYPEEKLRMIAEEMTESKWSGVVRHLISVCRLVSEKYPRSKARERIERVAGSYHEIIEELTWQSKEGDRLEAVVSEAIRLGVIRQLVRAISSVIKSLAVDHLHIVGDIFDRGPRADVIMDELMEEASVDIQWGNHDALWLGAAAGVDASIACVLNNSLAYKNLDVLEIGYGISLRPLALFAAETYGDAPGRAYMPRGEGGDLLMHDDDSLIAGMRKAISIIQFKLEGQLILCNPDFDMNDRLLLDKIDLDGKTVQIGTRSYPLSDVDFPTLNPDAPYELTEREKEVVVYFRHAFSNSERLRKHARFLYEVGSIYKIYNGNLLFHGSIPLDENGDFMSFRFARGKRGRELMDYCDLMARLGYFAPPGSAERLRGGDFLWFFVVRKELTLDRQRKDSYL
ncbi:MAG: fructose-bisphosphatase class III [Clostridia bacterium]|nr:fructose-bisphosphatase class III [Clostridia bacterium]